MIKFDRTVEVVIEGVVEGWLDSKFEGDGSKTRTSTAIT